MYAKCMIFVYVQKLFLITTNKSLFWLSTENVIITSHHFITLVIILISYYVYLHFEINWGKEITFYIACIYNLKLIEVRENIDIQ